MSLYYVTYVTAVVKVETYETQSVKLMHAMTHPSLPIHTSVIVIGGGIMGCSTHCRLAQMVVGDAILLERNKLTYGTT